MPTFVSRACDVGNLSACNNMGIPLLDGDADVARAASLFDRACAGGIVGACGNLGMLYHLVTLPRVVTIFGRSGNAFRDRLWVSPARRPSLNQWRTDSTRHRPGLRR
jgi:TPR repeat protein